MTSPGQGSPSQNVLGIATSAPIKCTPAATPSVAMKWALYFKNKNKQIITDYSALSVLTSELPVVSTHNKYLEPSITQLFSCSNKFSKQTFYWYQYTKHTHLKARDTNYKNSFSVWKYKWIINLTTRLTDIRHIILYIQSNRLGNK